MKKLERMNFFYKWIFFALFLFAFSNSIIAGRFSITDVNLELIKIDYNNLGVIIWDQRPMVADKSQPESFLGYKRAIVGIAYPSFTKSNKGLTSVLLEKIESAYQSQEVKINIIESSQFDKEYQILEKISNYEHDRVLLIKLNKLYFDGVQRYEYVVDIEMQLFNTKGMLLFNKNITEKIPMGSGFKLRKTIPNTLKQIIENLLNGHDVVDAISKKYTEPADIESLDRFDLIITKDGKIIESEIIEINDKFIKYRLHSKSSSPTRIINISKVLTIRYKNGQTKILKPQ